MLGFNC